MYVAMKSPPKRGAYGARLHFTQERRAARRAAMRRRWRWRFAARACVHMVCARATLRGGAAQRKARCVRGSREFCMAVEQW